MNKIISATKVRKDFFRLIQEMHRDCQPVIITIEGFPRAVMISIEDFESWQETLGVLRDFPDLKKDIDEFQKDLRKGTCENYSSLDKLLAKEGYILADKPQKKYELSNNRQAKRRKRAGKNRK